MTDGTCRRALEIDLLGFLATPRRADFDDFRAHYPTCRHCAAEVRAWTELADGLAGLGEAHPSPEQLARFEDAGGRLAGDRADEAERVRLHLETCASCRDELRALRAFAPEGLAASAGGSGPGPAEDGGRAASLARRIGRILWTPAVAWTAALLLAVPTLERLAGDPGLEPLARHPGLERPARDPGLERPARDPAAAGVPAPVPAPEAPGAEAPARLRALDYALEAPASPPAERGSAPAPARDARSRADAPRSGARPAADAPRSGARRVANAPQLDPDAVAVVIAPPPGAPLHLRLPPAAGLADAGAEVRGIEGERVAVTLRAEDGRRLHRLLATRRGDLLDVELPPDGLVPGRYRIALAGAGTPEEAPARAASPARSYRIEVRPAPEPAPR